MLFYKPVRAINLLVPVLDSCFQGILPEKVLFNFGQNNLLVDNTPAILAEYSAHCLKSGLS